MKTINITFIAVFSLLLFTTNCHLEKSEAQNSGYNDDATEAITEGTQQNGTDETGETISTEKEIKSIKRFINNLENEDKKALAEYFDFPFARTFPTPAIKDKADFINRFDEIFDAKFIQILTNSNTGKDWRSKTTRTKSGEEFKLHSFSKSGYSIDLKDNGTVYYISASKQEKKVKAQIIEAEKQVLHKSVRAFKEPVTIIKTPNFKIRIDDLGADKYRYASWKTGQKMSDKPNLILKNGTVHFDGSCGNHVYEFRNKDYFYLCSITPCGNDDTPPADLSVYQGADPNKEWFDYDYKYKIVEQDAKIIDSKANYRAFYDALDQ